MLIQKILFHHFISTYAKYVGIFGYEEFNMKEFRLKNLSSTSTEHAYENGCFCTYSC